LEYLGQLYQFQIYIHYIQIYCNIKNNILYRFLESFYNLIYILESLRVLGIDYMLFFVPYIKISE